MLIAIDFDGTCVEHKFPDIGDEIPYATEVLRAMQDVGHQLVLWTCREDHPTNINERCLTHAVQWFEARGIELYGVNTIPIDADFREYEEVRRKLYCQMYIDDCNLGGFPGWLAVHRIVLGKDLQISLESEDPE